ncbi:sigma-70 family RNA polymerase sigma factor [Pseudothauera rhizosphaerae]|uniref:Sigma-70 family RNA polymerase sigma factor n=1 Tax=Pseudothauera rhizosphaerae TaxID=2565932 RepID=A0A4S4AL25_9RHOO|nr:sigma-70 family RNA polymerase sigma factor [Pseudothauera rhizosphaerae]THF60184.1 sigma-70 family RNA polymerase sigma factor [Pseudothauera rhizosphaerae]
MAATESALHQQVETLYAGHHNWLRGWLLKRLGDSCTAADLAHDTFVRLLTRQEAVAIEEPRAYLTCIANGLVINLRQRRALERAYLEVLAGLPEPMAPSAEQRQIAIDALMRIDRLLDGLPARVREAFLLSQLDGLKYAEIALQLNVDLRSVKRYMAKAFAACLLGLD